jgi:hypothetical protein
MTIIWKRSAGLALVAVVLLGACSDSATGPRRVPTTLQITPASLSLPVGGTEQLSIRVLDQTGVELDLPPTGSSVEWSSLDPTVIEIDADGTARALRLGTTRLVARAGELQADIGATVTAAQIHFDESRKVSALVGYEGGTISVQGANGARFRLEFPRGSLDTVTQISLTPVAAIGNAPYLNLLGAVQFAPDGLQLLEPARLIVELPQVPAPGARVGGIGFTDDGTSLHLLAAVRSGNRLRIPVQHFSGAGAALIDDLDLFEGRGAGATEELNDELLDIFYRGEFQGDWELAAWVSLFQRWFDEAVEPKLMSATSPIDVRAALTAWRWWLGAILLSRDATALITALESEIESAEIMAGAMLRAAVNSSNEECIRERDWTATMVIPQLQRWAEDFGVAGPGSGLEPSAILAGICFQIHHADLEFPADPPAGEPSQLVVRAGIGYGSGPVHSDSWTRTRIRLSGSTDNTETNTSPSIEVFRTIIPTGETNLVIDVRTCIDIEYPGFSFQLSDVCRDDSIVRQFTREPDPPEPPEPPQLDLSGAWFLVVDGVCTGPMQVTHVQTSFQASASISGALCPFSASGQGEGVVDGFSINFGFATGSGSDDSGSVFGNAQFTGTISGGGTFMTGTYTAAAGSLQGEWSATKQQ